VILAGQRRFLAVRSLGWESVPCRVLDVSPQEAEEISLVENLQRAHLSHADKVRAFAKLNTHYGGDIVKICKAVSLAPGTVRNYINAGKLPDAVLARLDADKKEERLSLASAGRLSALRDDPRLESLAGALPRVGTNDAQKEAIERAAKNRTLTVEQIITAHAAEKTRKAAVLSHRTAPQPSNPIVVGIRAPEVTEVEKHKSSADSSTPRAAAETPWIWDEKGKRLVVPQSLYAGVLSFVRENIASPASIGGKIVAGSEKEDRGRKPRI
jgi:ParB/RepB/Spo0J family partition protein